MALRVIFTAVFLILTAACGDDDAAPQGDAADEVVADTDVTRATVSEGPCDWVTSDGIFGATGLTVEGTVPRSNGCTWELTESAAVLEGPNDPEQATFSASEIDQAAFDAAQEADDGRIVPIDSVGDEAFVHVAEDESETALYVRDGSAFFTLRLAGALDGANANTDALVDLGRTVLERANG